MTRRAQSLLRGAGDLCAAVVLFLVGLAGRALRWLTERRTFVWLLSRLEQLERTSWALVAALALSVLALTMLAGLNGIVAGLHVPGASSYTVTDLADTGLDRPRVERAEEVLTTWREAQIPDGFRPPGEVVWGFVLVDSLFAPAYCALLAFLLLKIGRALTVAGSQTVLEDLARRQLLRRGADPTDPALVERLVGRLTLRLGLHARLARFALSCVPLLLVADLLENGLTGLLYSAGPESSGTDWLFYALWAAGSLKWLLAVLVVVPGLVAGLAAALFHPLAQRQLTTVLVVVRPQLLLLAVFVAALLVPDQAADALRNWRDDWVDGAVAVLLTAWFAVAGRASARILLGELRVSERPPPGTAALVGPGLALFALGLVGEWRWDIGQGLYVPAAILVVVGIASHPIRDLDPIVRWRDAGRAAEVLPRAIAGVPLVALGVALLLASLPEIAYATHEWFLALVALAAALQGWGWYWISRPPLFRARPGRVLLLGALGVLVLTVRVWMNPWRTAEVLGSIAVLAGALVALTLIAFALSYASEHRRPPAVFTALRLRRAPVFVLLALWFVLASVADRQGSYHDVRTDEASAAARALDRRSLDAGEALTQWREAGAAQGRVVPLVFVSAAGGGIRAAYWAASVLDCVLEGRGGTHACQTGGSEASARASRAVLAASGISGGSLGLAAYATHLRHQPEREGWIDERLQGDYIAPTLAWTLFADIPLSFVRRSGGTDRAAVLERAWERSWLDDRDDASFWDVLFSWRPDTDSSPFADRVFDLWARSSGSARFPVLLLNGTKVQDGCRFNASVLDVGVDTRDAEARAANAPLVEDCLALHLFEQAETREGSRPIYVPPEARASWGLASTDDLSDFLCPELDVRLSTLVNLSSRFPWVEPAGRLEKRNEKCEEDGAAIHVVDGGYFDTSGASPLVELWQRLEPRVESANRADDGTCIVPFFLQIDTGYSDPVRPTGAGPLELLVPLQAVGAARQAREANARQAAALAFSGPIPGPQRATLNAEPEPDRFAHVYPRAHPGSKAPLGWTLSRTARDDLKAQLELNAAEIRKIRKWFGAGLGCSEVTGGDQTTGP